MRLKQRKLPLAVRKDASTGTFKEIDTFYRLVHEYGHEVEDLRVAETDILHELVT